MWTIIFTFLKNPKNLLIAVLVIAFIGITSPLYIQNKLQKSTIEKQKVELGEKDTKIRTLGLQIITMNQNIEALKKYNSTVNVINQKTTDIQNRIANMDFKPNITVVAPGSYYPPTNPPITTNDPKPVTPDGETKPTSPITGGNVNAETDPVSIGNTIIDRFNNRLPK